jgi:hypothetical protein
VQSVQNPTTPTKVGVHISTVRAADKWAPAFAGVVLILAFVLKRRDAFRLDTARFARDGCFIAFASSAKPPRLAR